MSFFFRMPAAALVSLITSNLVRRSRLSHELSPSFQSKECVEHLRKITAVAVAMVTRDSERPHNDDRIAGHEKVEHGDDWLDVERRRRKQRGDRSLLRFFPAQIRTVAGTKIPLS